MTTEHGFENKAAEFCSIVRAIHEKGNPARAIVAVEIQSAALRFDIFYLARRYYYTVERDGDVLTFKDGSTLRISEAETLLP